MPIFTNVYASKEFIKQDDDRLQRYKPCLVYVLNEDTVLDTKEDPAVYTLPEDTRSVIVLLSDTKNFERFFNEITIARRAHKELMVTCFDDHEKRYTLFAKALKNFLVNNASCFGVFCRYTKQIYGGDERGVVSPANACRFCVHLKEKLTVSRCEFLEKEHKCNLENNIKFVKKLIDK